MVLPSRELVDVALQVLLREVVVHADLISLGIAQKDSMPLVCA